MISLPPHTTHKLQPLDRDVMKPFKLAYNEACSTWLRKYSPLKISLKDVAGLVNIAFSTICRMELARSAFKCTGLHPLNKNIFTDLYFIGSASESLPDQTQFNNPGPSTSSEPTTCTRHPPKKRLQEVMEKLSPVPSNNLKRKLVIPKRRDEQSEVLTSLPYKKKTSRQRRKGNGK